MVSTTSTQVHFFNRMSNSGAYVMPASQAPAFPCHAPSMPRTYCVQISICPLAMPHVTSWALVRILTWSCCRCTALSPDTPKGQGQEDCRCVGLSCEPCIAQKPRCAESAACKRAAPSWPSLHVEAQAPEGSSPSVRPPISWAENTH